MIVMGGKSASARAQRATVGYAYGATDGVAYVRLARSQAVERTIRVTFRCQVAPALLGHDVGYAALLAIARTLREDGVREIVFELADARIVDEMRDRGPRGRALAMAYVMLGCELNRFGAARVEQAHDEDVRDLVARARADVSLHVAA